MDLLDLHMNVIMCHNDLSHHRRWEQACEHELRKCEEEKEKSGQGSADQNFLFPQCEQGYTSATVKKTKTEIFSYCHESTSTTFNILARVLGLHISDSI